MNPKDKEISELKKENKILKEDSIILEDSCKNLEKELDKQKEIKDKVYKEFGKLQDHVERLNKELDELKNNSLELNGDKHQKEVGGGDAIESINTTSSNPTMPSDSIIPKNRDQRLMKFGFDVCKQRIIDKLNNEIYQYQKSSNIDGEVALECFKNKINELEKQE